MQKKFLVSGALLLGALGLVGCASDEAVNETAEEKKEAVADFESQESASTVEAQYTTAINQALIDDHTEIYEEIIAEFQNGQYSLEEPLVVQDPYGRAPLTALVLFETEAPAEITVSVAGKTEEMTIAHTYSGYETTHKIPVLGLYPDYENQVTITAETEAGEVSEMELTLETDPTPEDLLNFDVKTADTKQMEPGLTFVSPSRVFPTGFDSKGDVRWYSPIRTYNNVSRLDNGRMLMATLEEGREHYDQLTEADMLGRVHQAISIEMEHIISTDPLHHDVIILPNGNYLALLHDGSDAYVEDEIAELDRETGEVVHRINLKDVFPAEMYEEYDGHQADVGDWMHVNAVWMTEDEESILLSARQQDVIIKLSYPAGEIEWLLADPEGWPEEVADHLLEPIGDNFKYQAGQHAVMELPDQDGQEETMDILLFDNNRVFSRGDEEASTEFSRAVQYRIHEAEGTVEEIWSYGEERGTEFYSDIVSDADYLPETGHVLVHAGRVLDEDTGEIYSKTVEVTKTEEPEVVFEAHYGPFGVNGQGGYVQMYRAERFPLYPENK